MGGHSWYTHPATTTTYTLSLHDALPISGAAQTLRQALDASPPAGQLSAATAPASSQPVVRVSIETLIRSEEHTSELQSRVDLVCRLLLEKKKNEKITL